MDSRFWRSISYIFHPVLMPTLGIALVMMSDPFIYLSLDSPTYWIILISAIFVCTALFPLFTSWLLLITHRVASLTNPTDQERKLLIVFSEMGFLLAYYLFHNMPVIGKSLNYFVLGINIAMILTLVTNMLTRISLHAVGMGGIIGTVIGLMYYTRVMMFPLAGAVVVIAGIVGLARYKLKAHEPADIYIGYIVGIASQAAVFMIGAH